MFTFCIQKLKISFACVVKFVYNELNKFTFYFKKQFFKIKITEKLDLKYFEPSDYYI